MHVRIVDANDIHDPVVRAMLQAFYSRSPMPIDARLASLGWQEGTTAASQFDDSKIKEAMQRYYIGYGHDSIGQLGEFTFYIEGVSMLAAKAVQASRYYRGQECSTRYMDWSKDRWELYGDCNPTELMSGMFAQYRTVLEYQKALLTERFPNPWDIIPEGTQISRVDAVYKNTINARAFDIARGFLPAGATTMLSWQTDFDTANKHLAWLDNHPLDEVRLLSKRMRAVAKERYPDAIKDAPALSSSAYPYADYYSTAYPYVDYRSTASGYSADFSKCSSLRVYDLSDECNKPQAISLDTIGSSRDRFERFPSHIGCDYVFAMTLILDFGSFRDLQRHRPGYLGMPLLRDAPVHDFYTKGMPWAEDELNRLARMRRALIKDDELEPDAAQYLYPMGTIVAFNVRWDLEQLIYILELRSGTSVHPTLRKLCHDIYDKVRQFDVRIADMIRIDRRHDYANKRRGTQTIEER